MQAKINHFALKNIAVWLIISFVVVDFYKFLF